MVKNVEVTLKNNGESELCQRIQALLDKEQMNLEEDKFLERYKRTYPDKKEETLGLESLEKLGICKEFRKTMVIPVYKKKVLLKNALQDLLKEHSMGMCIDLLESYMHFYGWKMQVSVMVRVKLDDATAKSEGDTGRRLTSREREALEKHEVLWFEDMPIAVRKEVPKAMAGNAGSQCALGRFYGDSQSNFYSFDEAEFWLKQSMEGGYIRGKFELAGLYDKCSNNPTHRAKAISYYLEMAETGYPSAQYAIGMKYFLGDGVPEDRNKSEKWLSEAKKQGHEDAKFQLRNMR